MREEKEIFCEWHLCSYFYFLIPASVLVNGNSNPWSYDGSQMHVVIETPALSTSSPVTVDVTVADPSYESVLFGIKGQVMSCFFFFFFFFFLLPIFCFFFFLKIFSLPDSPCQSGKANLGHELVHSWSSNRTTCAS